MVLAGLREEKGDDMRRVKPLTADTLRGMAFDGTAIGIRDKPIAPGSPWQNGFVERLIGSIRRECVDHVVAFADGRLVRFDRGVVVLSDPGSLADV